MRAVAAGIAMGVALVCVARADEPPSTPPTIAPWVGDNTIAAGAAPATPPSPPLPPATTGPPALSPVAPPGTPISTDALFERGNQAYLHGDYRSALETYEQVASLGVIHEDLYYALGNTYFKLDRLGPAILNYERALALDPGQEDAQANLRLAFQMAAQRWQDKLVGDVTDPLWMRTLSAFTPGGLTLLFLAFYTALFLLLLFVYLLPSGFARVTMAVLLIFVVLGTVGAGGLLAGRWWLANRADFGITLPDEVAVKEGPDASYQTSFSVHAGLRVRAIAHDGDWVKVRLQNGLEGWVPDRDFGRL